MEGKKAIQFWGKIEKYCWQSKNISHPRYPWWLSCISHQYKILGSRSISHIQPITITLISNFDGKLKNIVNTIDKYLSCEISMVVTMYRPPIHPKNWCNIGILTTGLVDTWFVDRWIMTLFILGLYLMCRCPKYSHKSFWTQGSFLSSDLLPAYQILREKWKLLLTWPMNISYLWYPWWLSCFGRQYI